MDKIEDLIKEVPAAPKEIEQWLRTQVFKGRFIIYDAKTKVGTCTLCGAVKEVSEYAKHNSESWCPSCGAIGKYKDKRYGRKNLEERARVMILGRRGKSVYAILSKTIMDYQKAKPEIFRDIEAIYKFNRKEQKSFALFDSWYQGEYWSERKRFTVPYRTGRWSDWQVDTVLYQGNLKKVFKNTDLRYCEIEKQSADMGCGRILNLLLFNSKFESMEKIFKTGLTNIIKDKLDNNLSLAVNWKANDLRKALGLNRAELKEAIRLEIGNGDLLAYKRLRKRKVNISFETVQKIGYSTALDIVALKSCMDPERLVLYLSKQKGSKYSAPLKDYKDYLEECEALGFDLKDKRILYPKNLQKAHEQTSIQAQVKASRDEDVKIRQKAKTLEKISYQSGNLIIRAARSAEEIIREGNLQKHCVASYMKRVANGSTSILLIRHKDKPDTPFYTLEYDKGNIIQCRGKCNCSMTDEVKTFAEKWLDWTKNPEKKEKSHNVRAMDPIGIAV